MQVRRMYRIREVDGNDDDISDTLGELHQLTFLDAAPVPKFDRGHWWLAFCGPEPVAFAGVIPSTHVSNAGYFCRVGVLGKHCGHRLQLRLMRAMEARARLNGWCSIVSDTTDNMHSANNFIRAGYRLGLAEHALLAQGRKIAARPLHTFNCTIRPVAYWPPGLFAFWDQRLVAE
jgi:hypothetical protein